MMSNAPFKVMLATDADLTKLKFPILASTKLDGVRAYVSNGVVYSRSNKLIPNKFVQGKFKHLEHFDGELIFGDPTAKDCYRRTVSAVMGQSTDGEDVNFYAFDHVKKANAPYRERHKSMKNGGMRGDIFLLTQFNINNLEELLALEERFLGEGYEGLILRDPDAPYKQGRSTVREGYLLKLKRFTDAEAMVIGYEERQHNGNAATVNELGRTSRSSHKSGKSGRGDLGALVLRTSTGIEFSCGTGFTDEERANLWAARDLDLVGRIAKYKFFDIGVKTAPRHPVFLGFRDKRDL